MNHKGNTLLLFFFLLCGLLRLSAQQAALLLDIKPGTGKGVDKDFTAVAGGKYFFYGSTDAQGRELWVTDGTPAGTKIVKDIKPGTASGCDYYPLVAFKGKVWFGASSGGFDDYLWCSDGTEAGTQQMSTGRLSFSPRHVAAGANYLYYAALNASGTTALWRTDGTAAGTVQVADVIGTYSIQSSLEEMAVMGDDLYMSLNGPGTAQLWKSDGTQAGTVLVKNIGLTPGNFNGDIQNLTVVGNKLYFAGDKNYNAWFTPWVSDGTTAGTVELAVPNTFGSSRPEWFFPFKNKVYFAATNEVPARSLWATDGTPAGTKQVKQVGIAEFSGYPVDMAADANYLYFAGKTSTNGTELWRTDGTEANTLLVKDLDPGSFSSSPANLTFANGKLYFQANVGGNGAELCLSDGSATGTKQVTDFYPTGTSNGSFARGIRPLGNTLVFIGDHPAHDITSGLRSPQPSISFAVSPNPSTGPLRVVLPEGADWAGGRFRLFNALGALAWEGQPDGLVSELHLPAALGTGLYWLEFAQPDGGFGRTALTLLR
jgi:ELWxxDGT repeat protein